MLQEVFEMTDTAGPVWTEGIVGDIWDQTLTLCHPQAVGHIQLTCRYWKQQCRLRLTQLELPPQPITELQALAAALPSIKQLRLRYRNRHVPESYMQAPEMHILREFSLLTSLKIEGDLRLDPAALKVLEDLSGLQVLSLPDRRSLAQQVTDKWLPGYLTSLSIDGLALEADWSNWQGMPDTLHSVHLGQILITSGSHLTWLQQLSSIQNLSMKISVTRSEIVDPQLGCCPGDWLLTLTSISSLYLWDLPAVCIAAVSLTWLSALSIFAQSHQVLIASTLASLAQLTRLTSLRLKSPALGNVQLTFLHCLADLAVCELDASYRLAYT